MNITKNMELMQWNLLKASMDQHGAGRMFCLEITLTDEKIHEQEKIHPKMLRRWHSLKR